MEAETPNHSSSAAAVYGDEDAVVAANNSSPKNIRSASTDDGGESQPPPQHDDGIIDTTNAARNNNDATTTTFASSKNNIKQTYRNINSYYGHKIGFYQTLSLILNAGLMIYAHLGLSAVIYSSRDPSITAAGLGAGATKEENNGGSSSGGGAEVASNSTVETAVATCNEQDVEIWIQSGGESTRPTQSNFCSRIYTDSVTNNLCLITPSCISECFQSTYKYSEPCSNCFAAIPTCSIQNMCTYLCAADSFSEECRTCNLPCVEEFNLCTGLPEVEETSETTMMNEGNSANNTALPQSSSSSNTITQNNNEEDTCNRYDLSQINQWYTAYELTFVRSIKDAWNGDAQVLAFIIVLFSGIWPYAKNVILVIVWYTPMSKKRQTDIILWLSRLSKYTLVDVFAVIGVLVGVQLQLNVGGTDALIRAEPRFGIIVSTVLLIY